MLGEGTKLIELGFICIVLFNLIYNLGREGALHYP